MFCTTLSALEKEERLVLVLLMLLLMLQLQTLLMLRMLLQLMLLKNPRHVFTGHPPQSGRLAWCIQPGASKHAAAPLPPLLLSIRTCHVRCAQPLGYPILRDRALACWRLPATLPWRWGPPVMDVRG